jgi:CBS domain-containing protein
MNIHIRKQRSRSAGWSATIAALVAALGGAVAGFLFSRARGRDASEETGSTKRVDQTMTPEPKAIAPLESVVEAAKLMRAENVGSLPVVESGRLVGMVTDRDIALRVVADAENASAITVGQIASSDPVTVKPDANLDEALGLMAKHQVRRMPVVQNDRLVGIVAQADVALEGDERKTGEVVEQISR